MGLEHMSSPHVAATVDAVLLPDGWHLVVVGSFHASDGLFQFVTSWAQTPSFAEPGSTVTGPVESVLAVRIPPPAPPPVPSPPA